MKSQRSFFLLLSYCSLLIILLCGCATVSTRDSLPAYSLNGTKYVSLLSLCKARDIDWDFDAISRNISLRKGVHKINLMISEKLILVDGVSQNLRYPVDIYQGQVVVPYRFKTKILDSIFARPDILEDLKLSKIKKIVIDPGHGGKDPGALCREGYLNEKDINLDVARRLSELLTADGFGVIMTRHDDRFISLGDRVKIANGSGADLFISIHSNANHVRSLNGFEVYYVAADVDDLRRALDSAKEVPLKLASAEFGSQSDALKLALWDIIYTSDRAEAVKLSNSICKAAQKNLNVSILGIKGARFEVLKGVRMAAVLIEIGFLSNYNEEQKLKTGSYRRKIAESIASGIRSYARETLMARGPHRR